ncbi:hypothetical protein SNEBB_009839, partial [Seison nebaliae]
DSNWSYRNKRITIDEKENHEPFIFPNENIMDSFKENCSIEDHEINNITKQFQKSFSLSANNTLELDDGDKETEGTKHLRNSKDEATLPDYFDPFQPKKTFLHNNFDGLNSTKNSNDNIQTSIQNVINSSNGISIDDSFIDKPIKSFDNNLQTQLLLLEKEKLIQKYDKLKRKNDQFEKLIKEGTENERENIMEGMKIITEILQKQIDEKEIWKKKHKNDLIKIKENAEKLSKECAEIEQHQMDALEKKNNQKKLLQTYRLKQEDMLKDKTFIHNSIQKGENEWKELQLEVKQNIDKIGNDTEHQLKEGNNVLEKLKNVMNFWGN